MIFKTCVKKNYSLDFRDRPFLFVCISSLVSCLWAFFLLVPRSMGRKY